MKQKTDEKSFITALLIEDSAVHAAHFEKSFRNLPSLRTEMVLADSVQAGFEVMSEREIHLVFLDLDLPLSHGLERLSLFLKGKTKVPVVVLTALNDTALSVQAVQMGAQDYVVKGECPKALLERVTRYAIERSKILNELESQCQRVQESLRENEVLLKEVHHRVKNNLQVISSLLRLQADTCEDPYSKSLLSASEQRVRSMALVHERMYKGASFQDIDFGEYIREMSLQLVRSMGTGKAVALEVDAEKIKLPVDKAIPCGLLVNEMITNSLKHAFSEQESGVVRVELKKDGSKVSLAVSDNGKGFPIGFDPNESKTLGFELIAALTSQLKGEFQFTPVGSQGQQLGVALTVTFPSGEICQAH